MKELGIKLIFFQEGIIMDKQIQELDIKILNREKVEDFL